MQSEIYLCRILTTIFVEDGAISANGVKLKIDWCARLKSQCSSFSTRILMSYQCDSRLI